PLRRALLDARVRVRRLRHPGPSAREGAAGGVGGDGAGPARARPAGRAGQGGVGRGEAHGNPGMTTVDVLIAALGAVALGSGLLVVTTRHVVRAGLWLVVTLGAVAGSYLVLTAELVAWVQVLLYVGAVVVLLLFAVMLTRAPIGASDDLDRPRWPGVLIGGGAGLGLAALFVA